MAKKAKGKKPAKAKKPKPAVKRPRPQRLAGLEDAPKDRVLDQCCEQLSDLRETINEALNTEKEVKARAVERLPAGQTYKAHGIELTHTQTDKLRVRMIADDEAGAGEAGNEGEAGEGEAGEGAEE